MPNTHSQSPEGARSPVPAPGPDSSFADRLNYLFDNLRPSPGDEDYRRKATPTGEFTNAWVAEAASALGPVNITKAYISQLRNSDESKNPSGKVIQTLANFFEVKAGYFLDDEVTQSIVGQFTLVKKLNEQGVANIAFRVAALSPPSRAAVIKVLDAAWELEGLPPAPEDLA
ncbi:hypothetical protein ACIQ9R_36275 [Streptomyces sp. NPDC094447]|uniref:hypothetical protein n=1 Tax=Streptomyces sp. NPDC094447 TaxID=3366062 RepID=UPI00381332EA